MIPTQRNKSRDISKLIATWIYNQPARYPRKSIIPNPQNSAHSYSYFYLLEEKGGNNLKKNKGAGVERKLMKIGLFSVVIKQGNNY